MVEYYAYSIYHGQAAALGGRDRTHGLAVGAFKQSCTNDSHNDARADKPKSAYILLIGPIYSYDTLSTVPPERGWILPLASYLSKPVDRALRVSVYLGHRIISRVGQYIIHVLYVLRIMYRIIHNTESG